MGTLDGSWKGSVYLSTAYIKMRQKGAEVSGVATVRSLLGGKSLYHFSGQFMNGKLEVAHHSGKKFVGFRSGLGKLDHSIRWT
jgi:hypothetical protein